MSEWERQENESPQAYEAFQCYLEERSITKVTQKLDKSRTIIGQWSSEWRWVARSRAYDNALMAVDFEEKRAAIRAMHEKHLKTADVLQTKAMKALWQLDMSDCSPRIILEAMKLGIELERRAVYEEMADVEIQGELSPEHIGFNPVAPALLKSLADERKAKALKGAAKGDMDIEVEIVPTFVDDVGGKRYDYSKLTPEEASTLRALSDKCMVYEDE